MIDKKKKGTVNQIKFHTSLTVRELVKKKIANLYRAAYKFSLCLMRQYPLFSFVSIWLTAEIKRKAKKKTRKEQKKKRDRKERAYTLDVVKTTGLWLLFKALKE